MFKLYNKGTSMTLNASFWYLYGVFNVNFKHILHLALVLTLKKAFDCLHYSSFEHVSGPYKRHI